MATGDPLRELIERQAIAEVLAQFCFRIDAYDIDGVSELFTEDCITDYGPARGGELAGRDAFRERIRKSQGQFEHTHHQLGQIVVELDGEEACSITYVTASHAYRDGRRHDSRLQYRDSWFKTPEGWRIRHRTALNTVVDGIPTEGLPWVPRKQPE